MNYLASFIHISQIFSVAFFSIYFSDYDNIFIAPPFVGVILPLIIWFFYRRDEIMNFQFKIILNWTFSLIIYNICIIPFFFIHIGMYFMIFLSILNIIFSLMGSYFVYKNKNYIYPFSINFIETKI
jgi:uncharacterized Tic20 family protein